MPSRRAITSGYNILIEPQVKIQVKFEACKVACELNINDDIHGSKHIACRV